jgi:hypothetical protein
MAKIVRITESELTNLIKDILKENTQVCVTPDEIMDLLIKFKFQVFNQMSSMMVLRAKPKKEMAHNIKYYEISIMLLDKKVKFNKVLQSEVNSPMPKMTTNIVKNLCDFKTINDFRRFVIDKFLDL